MLCSVKVTYMNVWISSASIFQVLSLTHTLAHTHRILCDSMSDTSDSDEGSAERKDRMARMQAFRAKKNQQTEALPPHSTAADHETPLCVQIGWPPDYIEYTGIWTDCRRRGWNVVGTDRRPMSDPAASIAVAPAEHTTNSDSAASSPGAGPGEEAGRAGAAQEDEIGGLTPNVQFVPYKQTAWTALLKGQVLANHYYMRSGLIRKAELATT